MESLLQDLRQALRGLRRASGFTAAAVLTLALGIGTATAGFTLLNWVLLRPLPGVRDAGRLGLVWFAVHSPQGGFMPQGITTTDRDQLIQASPAVRALAGDGLGPLTLVVAGQPARELTGHFVTGDYFATLGAAPRLGRTLLPDDDVAPGRMVAVISDRLWQSTFGGRPDIVGRPLMLNGLSFTIVGVMNPGFQGVERFYPSDIWVPLHTVWTALHAPPGHHPPVTFYASILRLAPGATFDQARAQLSGALRPIVADTSRFASDVSATVFPGVGLSALGRDAVDHQLALVMALAGLILLVTCANVANLLLLRQARRRSDTMVRVVLGASSGRLVRQALSESTLLGVGGALIGLLIAVWLTSLFRGFQLLGRISLEGLHVDWRSLSFATAAGLFTALGTGLIAVVVASRANLASELKASARGTARQGALVRWGLSTLQVAVSLSLVTGSLLFAHTLRNYAEVPLGFEPARVSHFAVEAGSPQGYTRAQTGAYLTALLDHTRALPGTQAAIGTQIPFSGISNQERVRRAGAQEVTPIVVTANAVSGGYFAVLGIPILRGVTFSPSDEWPDSLSAEGKVMLSQRLARELFRDQDPLGRLVELSGYRHTRPAAVVGVVGDIHWGDRAGEPDPLLYQPLGQGWLPENAQLVVRSQAPLASLTRDIQEAGRQIDARIPITPWGALSESIAAQLSTQTVLLRLLGLMSALTLGLTAVGLSALIAYGVAMRTREFGVRLALGATDTDIIRTAVRPVLDVGVAGIAGGVVGTLYLTRFIAVWLYGIGRNDPLTILGAAAVLGVAVLVAAWGPARRAARVDPMVALRYE